MEDRSKKMLLSVLGIFGLVIMTFCVTYAIFTYTKLGTTDNTITSGTLKFLYTENSGNGSGITMTNAFPISDSVGKELAGNNNVFEFKVEATNTSDSNMPYEVTLRKNSSSTLDESVIKVYLTDNSSSSEDALITPTKYSLLTDSSATNDYEEKTLYTSYVPANTSNYLKSFKLRIWIDEDTDFSGIEQSDGTIVYPYNDKTFKVTVNVYSNLNAS